MFFCSLIISVHETRLDGFRTLFDEYCIALKRDTTKETCAQTINNKQYTINNTQ